MIGWLRRLFGGARASAAHQGEPAPDDDDDDNDDNDDELDTSAPALTDELDLHTFQPRDVADLVDEYLRAAREAGLASVRVIHGKGKGTLRRIVHGVCERHPDVASFALGDQRSGSWGATVVQLKR